MDRRGRRNGGEGGSLRVLTQGGGTAAVPEGRAQRGEGLTEALALPAQGAAQHHPRTLGLDHL